MFDDFILEHVPTTGAVLRVRHGGSSKPVTTDDPAPYSERAMATDCLDLIRILGQDRFAVVGHDRGSHVALGLALDHPDAVSALAVLGTVPIGEALTRCDATFARAGYHWFFFAPPETPERVINADPDSWYGVGGRATPERLGTVNFDDFRRAVHDPATVHAMLEDVPAVWRPWTTDLDELAAALLSFLDGSSAGGAR